MLGLRQRSRRPGGSLEREVIGAVMIMYVIICAMLLGMHYGAPRAAATGATSSTSPSHGGR